MEGVVVPMVSCSRGSMNSLLHKLTELNTRNIQGLPRAHVERLLEALMGLSGEFVDKVAGQQEADGRVKAWMKQVRQLVVDIEDWVDPKLRRRNKDEPDNGSLEEPENESLEEEDIMTNDEILQDFTTQIDEACELCTRYELVNKEPADPVSPADGVPSDEPRRLLLRETPVGLVGVDGPTQAIVKKLTDMNASLKVVSMVGAAGLGKTTLAKRIYEELQGQFTCQVFVSVGQRTPVSTALMDILRQVKRVVPPKIKEEHKAKTKAKAKVKTKTTSRGIQAIITDLRGCLRTERYLIIIDGVWSTWDWKVINCALPENYLRSRVLTTTCSMSVAQSCSLNPSEIIQVKALSRVNSEKILKGMFDVNPPSGMESKEIFDGEADDMLKICGGVPLAIIIVSGLLSWKSAKLAEPKMLGKSDCRSEAMTKILCMSYDDLSVPLQSCFLYLSVFPEGYIIKKDRLIRLWRAEGFIPGSLEESMWATGERYFKELISRRLIQPVLGYEDDHAVSCTVHDVVLDFLACLASKENFVTVGAELKPVRPLEVALPWSLMERAVAGLTPEPFLCYETVRRLSLQCCVEGRSDNLVSSNVHLCRVRSLLAFGASNGLPDLRAFKLIRVLDLEGSKSTSYFIIGSLFLLRYLGLKGTRIRSKDIERMGEFDHLQTLDIRRTGVQGLPIRMDRMPNLVSMLGDGLTFAPVDLEDHAICSYDEHVQNLEELSTIDITDERSRDDVATLLFRSKKLRMLGVRANRGGNTHGVIPFLNELRKYNLESLIIESDLCGLDEWEPWPELRRFELTKLLPRVPESWASLDSLTHLDFAIRKIEATDVLVLGELPKLTVLNLLSWEREGSGSIVSSVGFQSLEVASFKWLFGGMWLHFQEGAMPKLLKLRLEFNAAETMMEHGIGKFPCNLTQVAVSISCQNSTQTDVQDVERAIRDQVATHPRSANLSLQLTKYEGPVKMKPSDYPQSPSALVPSTFS
ncbi:hypothetical protein CFC21_081118 [Triticum aestivum]|uniref:Uncharacterized protein n=3 Tax=Triticinae TaxID=1648030 RepID=A0A453MJX3_AEGTS|nr:disease resistance protein RGA5 [Aegilops tauschii subsp. strangulata]XP_020158925.1 disease resistance protein RGA5 [Aegilops tauschii subsp. strangulata]XP_020158927.1 disease resistance protein RGA5 [Aegilops tauschii subsp. strangulata]XP_044400488.1 disease resistance protein RGA5-like [Triticum aestivum]XP_044400489.1 disease resistance protein RGA5-like [Triticum aestivum]XP_044400490.1 disease resistance protein RGA5-like [Triticum aestivum]KAF7076479.1 hypothetical protein CFC21_0